LASERSWFNDVLADPELIIGVRDNYINIYMYGQSLFKISWKGERPNGRPGGIDVTTHPKFLIDPNLSKAVTLDGSSFRVSEIKPLLASYENKDTLARMKRAAKVYSGVEKKGVHQIFHANEGVVDLEIALSKSTDQEEGEDSLGTDGISTNRTKAVAKRIDIACFEKAGDEIHLCFWEAKDYGNAELWASGDTSPPVVGQTSEYKRLIAEYSEQIRRSYIIVARNLVVFAEMAKMAGRKVQLSDLITQVSNGKEFIVDPAKVGVVLFGYSKGDKDTERHKKMIKKLEDKGLTVISRGSSADIKLRYPFS
jgi:hypothetical protein